MKVILCIVGRKNLMRDVMAGPPTIFDAFLVSSIAGDDGKRSKLMFPGIIACGDNKRKLKDVCLSHLKSFGFDLTDVEIRHKVG